MRLYHKPMQHVFAEFFSGIGLVRKALEPLGWRCVFANDFDPKKAEMYRQNFDGDELVVEDIFKLRAADVPAQATLWTASFPCIDLSLAGNRGGLAGQHSGAYWGFIDLLGKARNLGRGPELVLVENVVGFATSADGADMAEALEALSRLGYRYDVVVVDAKHFTPQSRPRLFIVAELEATKTPRLRQERPLTFISALRPSAVEKFIAGHPSLNWALLELPAPPGLNKTLPSIIEPLPDDHEYWWSEAAIQKLVGAMSSINRIRLARMLASPHLEYGTVYRRVRYGETMSELRCDGLAGCLRTPRGGSSKQFLVETRSGRIRARQLTVSECARLMGADDMRFDVPANQAWFGLGDAVCVPAVRWLVRHMCAAEEPARALAAAGG